MDEDEFINIYVAIGYQNVYVENWEILFWQHFFY